MRLYGWTACTIPALGDARGVCADLRPCEVLEYDPPYVTVNVGGIRAKIREQYVVAEFSRSPNARRFTAEQLNWFKGVTE